MRLAVCVLALLACGCSNRQVYDSAWGWRRNECQKIVNDDERARCLEAANTSYDKYKREQDEATKRNQ
jgi:hypothetical protein